MAPMDGVTDAAFRFIVAKYGKLARKSFDNQNLGGPDVIFTEFVPVDGICAYLRKQAGAEAVLDGLIFGANEKPIVVQIFGANPENFYKVAPFLCELGFDGIDINMGCPDKAIVKSGGGAALIDNPKLAGEIVAAVKRGVADWAKTRDKREIPVSVKTRIGIKENNIKEWAEYLSEMNLAAVSLHGRTLKQMYGGKADWDAIAEGAEIIKKSGVVVLGNGDIKNIKEGEEKSREYCLDGFLIGRAAMGNPWVFSGREASVKEKLMVAIKQARYYEQIFAKKPFVNMRKHLAWYCRGFAGASEARAKLMKVNNAKDCEEIIMEIINDLR